jgi:membrane protein DedA with SNARE-associated domain
MIKLRTAVVRRAAFVLLVLFMIPTVWFARHSYGSFLLLRSAYQAGAPDTSSIRSWMTLAYVGDAYGVSTASLIAGLGLPATTDPTTNLRAAAELAGVSPFQYVEQAQRAVAALGPKTAANSATESSGWLAALSDQVLSELLVYGYPILGLILLIGAIGVPLPDGAATVLAGSLAAQGSMSWIVAGLTVIIASLVGDIVGYAVGVLIGREFLDRHGYWVGYTPARWARVQWLFEEWGLATVFMTRTFVSYLSSVASLLAGVSRFPLGQFIVVSTAGRAVWTAAYLGLGYSIGADLDAATGFLSNLTGLLLCAIVLVVAGLTVIIARSPRPRTSH